MCPCVAGVPAKKDAPSGTSLLNIIYASEREYAFFMPLLSSNRTLFSVSVVSAFAIAARSAFAFSRRAARAAGSASPRWASS